MNARLTLGGYITGNVTEPSGAARECRGAGLRRGVNETASRPTDSRADDIFFQVPPSAEGYIVCFDTAQHPRFKRECFNNVARDGVSEPADPTPVRVAAHTNKA